MQTASITLPNTRLPDTVAAEAAMPLPADAPGIAPAPVAGPLAQAVKVVFRLLGLTACVLGVAWACGNIRQIPADGRAVVLRFGQIVRVHGPGLLIAFPSPIDRVIPLPAADKQIALAVGAKRDDFSTDETDLQLEESDDWFHLEHNRDAANAPYLLTGDGNVVRLDATLYFRIARPDDYVLAEGHVRPALKRLFAAAAVSEAASRGVEDFLVTQPEGDRRPSAFGRNKDDPTNLGSRVGVIDPSRLAAQAARRAALRGELVQTINHRLARLTGAGADLGVEVTRVDLQAILPPRAKMAFDDVLTAEQTAAQSVAAAHTDATHALQEANRVHDQIAADADAAATEMVRMASADAAPIKAIETALTGASPDLRQAMFLQAWRARVAKALSVAGAVVAVDGRSQAILPVPPKLPQDEGGNGVP